MDIAYKLAITSTSMADIVPQGNKLGRSALVDFRSFLEPQQVFFQHRYVL
jgi:hypothetical protein